MDAITIILSTGGVISALGVIIKGGVAMYKLLRRQEQIMEDVARMKKEQTLVFEGLMACLDGLEQLGANHSVPTTKGKLENWLNEQAHD